MKRFLISLAMVLVLVGTMAVPAMAAEGTKPAVVTVNTVIDVTITDENNDGIQFGGPWNQGDSDKPDILQSTADNNTPAVDITINPATNVDCVIRIKGTDFHATIPITGASWAHSYNSAKNPMALTNQLVVGGIPPDTAVGLWHFLDIPGNAAGGQHTSTFTYTIAATP